FTCRANHAIVFCGMKKILTYGTFDLIHIGHIRLLARARGLGDYLIVGLSTDEFNLIKHKESFNPYEHRKIILETIRYVDLVIPETTWDQKEADIKSHGVHMLVMGSDWSGKFDHLRKFCEVRYLPRTKNVSTSKLKSKLQEI